MAYRIWQNLGSWTVLSVLLGLVLLVAASLKGYEIATEVPREDNLLTSRGMLMLVVEWKVFFALWLLGGFYRCCPRTTHGAAVIYFCGLFGVAIEAAIAERPSCGCLGKVKVHPWDAVVFDFAVVILLASVIPARPVASETLKRYRWAGLAIGFFLFGLLSLITMKDYSTTGAVPQLRRDRRLNRPVTIELVRPSTETILQIGRNAAGVELTVDEVLREKQPDYGSWQLRNTRLWAVMEMLIRRQTIPARWKRVDEGYMMVPAARFGKSLSFWMGSTALLVLFLLGLRMLDASQSRKVAYPGETDSKTNS